MSAVRTARTIGVTQQLAGEDRRNLVQLRTSPLWDSVLNAMERFCIEQESELIRTPVGDDSTILAQHGKAQAAWEMFEHFQLTVLREVQLVNENYLREEIDSEAGGDPAGY